MSGVTFYVPAQLEAWERINKPLMARQAGYSEEMLGDLWRTGSMRIHAIAAGDVEVGYLVLSIFNLGCGPFLQVMWCEMKPCRVLRAEKDWLWDAARYLEKVAAANGCTEVRIGVSEDHPSKSWLRRLRGVGFVPRTVELGIRVAA